MQETIQLRCTFQPFDSWKPELRRADSRNEMKSTILPQVVSLETASE